MFRSIFSSAFNVSNGKGSEFVDEIEKRFYATIRLRNAMTSDKHIFFFSRETIYLNAVRNIPEAKEVMNVSTIVNV